MRWCVERCTQGSDCRGACSLFRDRVVRGALTDRGENGEASRPLPEEKDRSTLASSLVEVDNGGGGGERELSLSRICIRRYTSSACRDLAATVRVGTGGDPRLPSLPLILLAICGSSCCASCERGGERILATLSLMGLPSALGVGCGCVCGDDCRRRCRRCMARGSVCVCEKRAVESLWRRREGEGGGGRKEKKRKGRKE